MVLVIVWGGVGDREWILLKDVNCGNFSEGYVV